MNECRRSAKEVQKDIGARFKFYKPMRKSVWMSSLYDLQGTVKNEFLDGVGTIVQNGLIKSFHTNTGMVQRIPLNILYQAKMSQKIAILPII